MKKIMTFVFALLATPAIADEAPQRVLSVGGAVTEILFAIGEGNKVVGSDTTSYYPLAAAQMPKVGYQRALSAEGVLSLEPDLIVMTEDAGPGPVLKQLSEAGVKQFTVKAAKSLDDTLENITLISGKMKVPNKGHQLVEKLKMDHAALTKKVKATGKQPKIMFMMQHGGGAMMVAGENTSAEGIIELAGGINSVTGYEGYRPLTAESVVAQAPDYILTTTTALDAIGGAEELLEYPGLSLTPAGKNGHVIGMGGLLLLGFGPRSVQAAEELFQFTHTN